MERGYNEKIEEKKEKQRGTFMQKHSVLDNLRPGFSKH